MGFLFTWFWFFQVFLFLLPLIMPLFCTIQSIGHGCSMNMYWLICLHSELTDTFLTWMVRRSQIQGLKYQQHSWDLSFLSPKERVVIIIKCVNSRGHLHCVLTQTWLWWSRDQPSAWGSARESPHSPHDISFPAHDTFRQNHQPS